MSKADVISDLAKFSVRNNSCHISEYQEFNMVEKLHFLTLHSIYKQLNNGLIDSDNAKQLKSIAVVQFNEEKMLYESGKELFAKHIENIIPTEHLRNDLAKQMQAGEDTTDTLFQLVSLYSGYDIRNMLKEGGTKQMPRCAICNENASTGLIVDADCIKNMVQVVRCCDCKFAKLYAKDLTCSFWNDETMIVAENSYCSKGEKKEVQNENN